MWLWYLSDTSGEFQFRKANENYKGDFWIEDCLILSGSPPTSQTNTIRGGHASQSLEAAAALVSGKRVEELKLGFSINDYGEFSVRLRASDLNPRGLTLPSHNEIKEPAVLLEKRIDLVQVYFQLIDEMVHRFLELRCGNEWSQFVDTRIGKWIRSRAGSRLSGLRV